MLIWVKSEEVAMPSIVEAGQRHHHASGDAQMSRLFPDGS